MKKIKSRPLLENEPRPAVDGKPIAIDLFCGIGGMSLGMARAGFNVAAAIDYDPVHASVHKYNFPDCKTICASIEKISSEEFCSGEVLSGEVIYCHFSPPCQGFSYGGGRNENDPRNKLGLEATRIVKKIRPRYVTMENVKGITSGYGADCLRAIISDLIEGGYNVLNPKVLNTVNYGIPQTRERLWIIAARQDVAIPSYPKPTTCARANDELNYLPLAPNVYDAIADIGKLESHPELYYKDSAFLEYLFPTLYGQELRQLENYYVKPFFVDNIGLTKHTKEVQKRFELTAPGKREPVSRFHKLDYKGYCPTLRAGTARDRGAHTAPRPIHPEENRVITVREAGRLHSYPDSFIFHHSKHHGFRGIGNSIPPLMGEAIANAIMQEYIAEEKRLGNEIKISQSWSDKKHENTELLDFSVEQAAEYWNVDSQVIPARKNGKI